MPLLLRAVTAAVIGFLGGGHGAGFKGCVHCMALIPARTLCPSHLHLPSGSLSKAGVCARGLGQGKHTMTELSHLRVTSPAT